MKEKIGVALAGGGLQGFSHIGALRALEELNIDINCISGTSTGSIVASLYAIGFELDEIEKLFKENYKRLMKMRKSTFLKIAINFLLHKQSNVEGIIDGKIISDFINKAAKQKNVDLITDVQKRELAIATVDTKTMKECIFVSKNLPKIDENVDYISNINIGHAVRSSMAFPAIFTTSNFEKYNFIDGGTVDNLPTKVLKDLGVTKIISLSFDLTHYTPTNNLEDVIIRTLDIYSSADVKNAQKLADVPIEILNYGTSLLTVDDVEKTIQNGYDAVMKNKDKLMSNIIGTEKIPN